MPEVGLVRFGQVALDVAQATVPRYRTTFSKHLFTQPQLLAILCLMRYEDWTFREAEVRTSRIAPGVGPCECARLHDTVSFFAASRRPDHRPRGWRNGAPAAWFAATKAEAGSRRGGRHRFGARRGEHVLCAAHASSWAETAALAALAEVGGRRGFGSAVRVVATRAARAVERLRAPAGRSSMPLTSKPASGGCWRTQSVIPAKRGKKNWRVHG